MLQIETKVTKIIFSYDSYNDFFVYSTNGNYARMVLCSIFMQMLVYLFLFKVAVKKDCETLQHHFFSWTLISPCYSFIYLFYQQRCYNAQSAIYNEAMAKINLQKLFYLQIFVRNSSLRQKRHCQPQLKNKGDLIS